MTAILEDAKELVIDKWGTLNTAASPQKLPDGHSPNNQNVWMDEKPGSVVTANGYIKLGELPSGNPPIFFLDYSKSSDGTRKLICSDGITVYWTTDYVTFTTITTGLSQYFQLRGAVIRDKVWLTNGSDSVLTWDGTTLTTLDGTGGTPNVPKGKFISYHDERVWMFGISGDTSSLRFSELTDSAGTEISPDNANAWPADNELQISEGDADSGTGMFLYRGFLYCSKQYSIWRIVGYDVYTYTRVKTRASTGTRFQESIQIVDNLVHIIGVDGLYTFDGEEAVRISDIIDPSSAEEGVFAFRNLQQQLLNNQFWGVSETDEFAVGTVSPVISTANDKLTLIPADDSQDEFAAGTVKTNIDATTIPGQIRINRKTTGTDSANANLAAEQPVDISTSGSPSVIGQGSYLTDGVEATVFGIVGFGSVGILIDLTEDTLINSIFIGTLRTNVSVDIQYWVYRDGSPVSFVGNHVFSASASGQEYLFQFSPVSGNQIFVSFSVIAGGQVTIASISALGSAFEATATFKSKSIDYGAAPQSYGDFAVSAGVISSGHSTVTYFTESSDDGSTWDAGVVVTNGGAIGSTLRRYLRWGASFTSDGDGTDYIDKVFVGGTYFSEIHNTGGNINQWGPLQASVDKAGQDVRIYYRAASTEGGVSAESWTEIVPGAIPNTDVANQYVQVRIEMSTEDATRQPIVNSFSVNWVLATGLGINTLQNVASIVILNRYWLSAATLGATENDIVIVKGKSTFGSPWHKKDFGFLSFCRFLDYFIAGSSTDGSIYKLETGYSKNGEDMDAFYETRDFSTDNFQMKGREILVTADRSGPYDLSVGWSTDGGLTYIEKEVDLTREDGDSLSFTKKLNIGFMSDSVRFRVRINAADQPFSVDEIREYHRLTPQRGEIAA